MAQSAPIKLVMKNKLQKTKTIAISGFLTVVLLFVIGNVPAVIAEQMSSSNYKIERDSVNTGGAPGTSANYSLEETTGEVATGESSSANYELKAGYQQMGEVFLAMTAAGNVTMSPSIDLSTGGTSNGSTDTTVTTDNAAGYELYMKASSSPAMQGDTQGDSIDNYTPSGSDPDFTFSVAASAGEFGFTPEGTDIASEYKDNGSTCNTGSGDTSDACWNPITTTDELISRRTSANNPSGIETTVKFRITIGSSHSIAADTYTATATLTALAL